MELDFDALALLQEELLEEINDDFEIKVSTLFADLRIRPKNGVLIDGRFIDILIRFAKSKNRDYYFSTKFGCFVIY